MPLALIAAACLAVSSNAQSMCGQSRLCGDCNGSGTVGILDSVLAAQHAVGLLPSFPSGACDVDGGGTVDVLDALLIAQNAAGIPTAFACNSGFGTPQTLIVPASGQLMVAFDVTWDKVIPEDCDGGYEIQHRRAGYGLFDGCDCPVGFAGGAMVCATVVPNAVVDPGPVHTERYMVGPQGSRRCFEGTTSYSIRVRSYRVTATGTTEYSDWIETSIEICEP